VTVFPRGVTRDECDIEVRRDIFELEPPTTTASASWTLPHIPWNSESKVCVVLALYRLSSVVGHR
jgi:hypothetical protein